MSILPPAGTELQRLQFIVATNRVAQSLDPHLVAPSYSAWTAPRSGVHLSPLRPELFECKARAMQALEAAGFRWLADYSSIDILHDEVGLAIEGVRDRAKAKAILAVLQPLFVSWTYCHLYYEDHRAATGWRISLSQRCF
ncbi:hypothetical protein HQ590_14145 [bacterium]|nr:hypothetical protein [bacterium]